MIDKHGKCPACNGEWDDGDVAEVVSRLSVFVNSTEEVIENAIKTFGYTPENRVRFSKVITIQVGDKTYYQCNKIRCSRLFNIETEKQYLSLWDALQEDNVVIEIESKEEFVTDLEFEDVFNSEDNFNLKADVLPTKLIEEQKIEHKHEPVSSKAVEPPTNFQSLSRVLSRAKKQTNS
jgi:hypothetical protein